MSEFDCDICEDQGMCEFRVETKTMGVVELCDDCLTGVIRDDELIGFKKFAGLA